MEDSAPGARPDTPSSRRPRDLVISLLVLLVPLLVLVGGYQLVGGRNHAVPVDQSPQMASARSVGMEVHEPTGLGDSWVPVSAAFAEQNGAATLRLGFITPDDEPVQVIQSTTSAPELVAAELFDGASPLGPLTVAGVQWQRYPGSAGERALLWRDGALTVLVVGPTSEAELAELAGSLR